MQDIRNTNSRATPATIPTESKIDFKIFIALKVIKRVKIQSFQNTSLLANGRFLGLVA